jgi:DNA-binding XRE family transcriptional regulator
MMFLTDPTHGLEDDEKRAQRTTEGGMEIRPEDLSSSSFIFIGGLPKVDDLSDEFELTPLEQFGMQYRTLRSSAGLSLSQLAKKTGLSKKMLEQVEHGSLPAHMVLEHLTTLAQGVGVQDKGLLQFLLYLVEQPKTP